MNDDVPELIEITPKSKALHSGKRIPVTVLTGSLGAGKTTLLSHILQNSGKKVAVVLNDVGETMNIERNALLHTIIQSRVIGGGQDTKDSSLKMLEDWVEMQNGCLCCNLKDPSVAALEQLIIKSKGNIDHVVIECSGVADPTGVASMLWMDDAVATEMQLDGVVCVVDVSSSRRPLEWQRQIAASDMLIFNKVDLKPDYDRSVYLDVNPIAQCIESVRCQVDLQKVLNLNAYSAGLPVKFQQPSIDHHDSRIKAITLTIDKPVDRNKFERWIEELLWEHDQILRAKGVLSFISNDNQVTLQAVGKLYELKSSLPWTSESRVSKIVLIGEDLNQQELQQKCNKL